VWLSGADLIMKEIGSRRNAAVSRKPFILLASPTGFEPVLPP